jgi:hypothetical protein
LTSWPVDKSEADELTCWQVDTLTRETTRGEAAQGAGGQVDTWARPSDERSDGLMDG